MAVSGMFMFNIVYDDITGCCGEVPKIYPQRDGTILIENGTLNQGKIIKKLIIINKNPVSCSPLKTQYQQRGGLLKKSHDIFRRSTCRQT